MQRITRYLLLALGAALIASMVMACDGDSDNTPDPDGDVIADGDATDGDTTDPVEDGDVTTEDTEDNEGTVDGDSTEDAETEDPIEEDPLCPPQQQCTAISEDGYMSCMAGEEIPAGAQTQCHESDTGCPGNAACLYTNDEQTESVCVTNCGVCPNGTTCSDVTGDGYLGCLAAGNIPSGAQTQCHENGGCTGNATCFFINSERTQSVCIQNCSPCWEGSCPEGEICGESGMCEPEPCTEGSCPDDEVCVNGRCIPDIGDGPGNNPGTIQCELPPLVCEGTNEYCGELIQFDPTYNDAWADYPENGETEANQYRSWLRRDAVMLIKYATSKVACLAADWEFGNGGPLGLIDMSEADGSIPGTSINQPGHPDGTHTNGYDIDVSYYQVNTPDNAARPICDHYENGAEAYHCTATPHLLDPWRNALFLLALFEHPYIRVVGCDGKVGPMVESAMDILCDGGWADAAACNNRPLAYEETNQGYGWFLFHHHHMHVSFDSHNYGSKYSPSDRRCLVPGCDTAALQQYISRKMTNKHWTPAK